MLTSINKGISQEKTGFLKLAKEDSEEFLGSASDKGSLRSQIQKLNQDRPVSIIVKGNMNVTEQAARSCTIDCTATNTGERVQVTYTPIVFDFCIAMNEFPSFASVDEMVSHLEFLEVYQGKMLQVDKLMMAKKNELVFNALNAIKTPSTAYHPRTPYSIVGDALQVPSAEEIDLMNTLDVIASLHGFDFTEGINIVPETVGLQSINRQLQDAIQFVDSGTEFGSERWAYSNKALFPDNKMPIIAGVKHRGFAVLPNTVGVVENIPIAMKKGIQRTSSNTPLMGEGYDSTFLPISGDRVGVYHKTQCLDGQTILLSHQVSVNFAVVTAYNQDPANEASSVFEYQVLT